MQKIKRYFSVNGWKDDLDETINDIKDLAIIVRRNVRYSDNFYEDLTYRERRRLAEDANSLIFLSERDFQMHIRTNIWPVGRCVIYEDGKRRVFDDSFPYPAHKKKHLNLKTAY